MTQISLEMLESDPRVFDIAHAMVERRTPVLGVAHDMFDTTLARVDLPLTSRVAIGLGIRTFEVVAGEELAANVSSGELVRTRLRVRGRGTLSSRCSKIYMPQVVNCPTKHPISPKPANG